MEPNLCPFCGSTRVDYGTYPIGCCTCGAVGPQGYEGEVASWNTRPIEDALRAEVAALKDKLNGECAEARGKR